MRYFLTCALAVTALLAVTPTTSAATANCARTQQRLMQTHNRYAKTVTRLQNASHRAHSAESPTAKKASIMRQQLPMQSHVCSQV